MARVREIWRYPIKSMAGERLESCRIVEHGLEGDRRWAFIDWSPNRAGKPLTIRQHAKLLTYRARLVDGGVEVAAPNGLVQVADASLAATLAAESSRPLELREHAGGNFDSEHVLIVNLASVEAFALEAGMGVDRRRFRANLYVDGLEPEEEVRWLGRRIRAGEAEVEVVSRDERCVVITRDPDTTEAAPELLRLLTERHDQCMGIYCRVITPGRVAVGDLVG